jgi:peptide/nickel transport system ATP-binding protein
MNAVDVTGLAVHLRGVQAPAVIQSLDLSVTAGESFGVIGPSGCGKSTLLRVLAGIERRWQGSVMLLGRSLTPGRRFDPLLRRDVQMVFQDTYAALHPRHTVERVLTEPLEVHRIAEPARAARAALDEVGLSTMLMQRRPHELSGGQRQRIVIARSLLLKPALLLLDEPTSALDPPAQAGILNLLKSLKASRQVTLILVTHDRGVAAHLCERVAVMSHGRIQQLLNRSDLSEE